MEKIKLEIIGMSYSQSQSGAYALILGEVGGKRRLPIIIGGFEAQAIAIELEKMKPTRPLTHDLFKSFADTFHVTIQEVLINKFIEGVFHAEILCLDGTKEYPIDARTSDAVALSLRFNCPVYTNEKIMSSAGIVMDDEKTEVDDKSKSKKDKEKNMYGSFPIGELQESLQKAIEKEDYEKASQIRDEINRRKEK